MVASYAMPLNGDLAESSSHYSQAHVQSQHRKAAPDRIPIVRSPMAAAYGQNKPTHVHSHSLPPNAWASSPRSQKQSLRHQLSQSSIPSPTQDRGTPLANAPTHNNHNHNNSRMGGISSHLTPDHHDAHDGYQFQDVRRRSHGQLLTDEEEISSSGITFSEVLASILVPLPYALTVLVLKTYSRPNPLGVVAPQLVGISDDSSKIEAMLNTTHSMKFYTLCTITAMTLLLVGTLGKIKGAPRTLDRRKAALGNNSTKNYGVDVGTMSTAQRILGRILGVGLPIYAAGLLGGDRVAMIIFTALAGGVLNVDGKGEDLTRLGSMKRVFMQKKWTFAAMLAQIIADFVGLRGFLAPTALIGYLALICSIFAFPPPYSTSTPKLSAISQPRPSSEEKTSTVSTPWEPLKSGVPTTASGYLSPLIATQQDVDLTLFTGGLMFFLSLVIVLLTSISDAGITYSSTGYSMLVAQTMAISLTTINIKSLKTQQKIGVGTGLVLPLLLNPLFQSPPWTVISCQAVLAISSWVGVKADTMSAFRRSKQFHRRRADSYLATKKVAQHSRVTGILLKATDDWPLLHSILVEKDSRRIFYFMCLNFGFMLIQTFYAIVTGSLGLLSDSIHMLFDCLALVVGLCASVMSKWPPSLRFPYGFGKMDTLAGFANGVFLMLISVEIVYEAIERLVGGSKMQRIGELLVVSGMGLVVNLVGMLAFGHAHHGHGHDHSSSHTHDHSHSHASHSHDSHDQKLTNGEVAHSHNQVHDHSHDHSHSNGSHSNKEHEHSHDQQQKFLSESLNPPPTPFSPAMPSTPSKPTPVAPSHSHAHHDHSNENMHGIFLHVLADTLGSVAVVFSTILIHYTKWNGWDPLASCLIAILIFASAIPLVISSAKRLLLTVPANTEFDLRETLAGMGSLRGVNGVSVPRFWVEGSDIRGVMHVIVGRGVDCEEMRARAMAYLKGRGVDCLVQVEREGEGRCWCGGGVAR